MRIRIFAVLLIVACLGIGVSHGQVITNESRQVEITVANKVAIKISPVKMPPIECSMAEIQLKCNNKTTSPIKATVFCHVVFLKGTQKKEAGKDEKAIHEVFSFHNLDVPPGISTCTVVFSTLNISLKGDGKMKTYLVERIDPTPPPPRIWFLAAKGTVAMLDKPYGEVYKQLQLQHISNTLELPVKTTE